MKTDVLLVVDCSSRELVGAFLLKHYLANFNLSCQICSKLIWPYVFNKCRPTAVILPNAGSPKCQSIGDRAFAFVLPCESGNGQRDQVLNCHVGSKLYKCDTEFVDLFFSWGKQMTTWLLESGAYNADQIATCGNPSTDHWLLEKSLQYNQRVGLTTSFRVLSNSIGGHHNFFKWIYETEYIGGDGTYFSPPEHCEVWIYWEAAFIRSIVNIVQESLIPNAITCSIRPHPFEIVAPYKYLGTKSAGLVQIEKVGPITKWLDSVDLLLSYLSGSAVDAFVKGVPVVSLRGILNSDALNRIPKGFVYDYYEFCWQVGHVEEIRDYAIEAFRGKLEPARDMAAFTAYVDNHFSFPRKKPAAWLIAKTIADFLASNKNRPFRPLESNLTSLAAKWARKALQIYPEARIGHMCLKNILKLDEYSPLFTYITWKMFENRKAKQDADDILNACGQAIGAADGNQR